jgi:hypothetical protein
MTTGADVDRLSQTYLPTYKSSTRNDHASLTPASFDLPTVLGNVLYKVGSMSGQRLFLRSPLLRLEVKVVWYISCLSQVDINRERS